MTLNQLKYAIAVSESDSFNVAARKLYISQPSLSTSIHALEEETGIQIFRRSQNGIAVTPDGKEFLGYARQVMEQFELLDARYISKSDVKKKFSVSMQHYTFAVNAFVDLIRRFAGEEYDFSLRETETYEIIDDVAKMKSEIGILYLNSFNKDALMKIIKSKSLTFTELFTAKPHVFVSTDHPLADKKSVTMEELADYPYLSFEQGEHNSFYYSEEIFSTVGRTKNIRVTDRATLFNLLIGLNGYTVCSGVIDNELNGDNITAIPLDEEGNMKIGYIENKKILHSNLAEAYIEALKKHI